MSQKPKKHHFVPECYLNNFLIDDFFFTLDIRKVKEGRDTYPRRSNPSKICYLEDYYKIDFELILGDKFDDMFVESEVLKTLEDNYTKHFKILTQKESVSINESFFVSDFIVQLIIRNPFWFENTIKKKRGEWVENIFEEGFNIPEKFKSISIEIRQVLLDSIYYDAKTNPDNDKKTQLNSLILRHNSNERNKKFRDAIVNSSWEILVTQELGPFFITSDNPGVSVDIYKKTYNSKFNDGFTYYLPLSPRFCLKITDFFKDNFLENGLPYKLINKVEIGGNRVIEINNYLIQPVNNLLIANDKGYLNEIKKRNSPR